MAHEMLKRLDNPYYYPVSYARMGDGGRELVVAVGGSE